MDVANADQVKSGFRQTIEKFGKIDILVNNAAITRDGLAVRMKSEDWDAVLRTNLTGAHLCAQQAMSVMMRARYGRIINVTSVVAETGNPGQVNYVAAKAGLIGLTRALALEIASRNITVNAVAPRFVVSPMTDPLPQNVKDALLARIPLGRMGCDAEVAAAIVARAAALIGEGALAPAAAALEAAGCRYQWARTLVAMRGAERARGEAELAAMGATVMAWPPG